MQADILISELLGSFGDNELSPECLDGAQIFLKGRVAVWLKYWYNRHQCLFLKLEALNVNCTAYRILHLTVSEKGGYSAQNVHLHVIKYRGLGQIAVYVTVPEHCKLLMLRYCALHTLRDCEIRIAIAYTILKLHASRYGHLRNNF